MKWFDRWFANKCKQAWEEASQDENINIGTAIRNIKTPSIKVARAGDSDSITSDPITFKMFKASGGWAIEFRKYDNRNDRYDTSLYVINNEEELGSNLAKIITMESLKR